MEKNKNRPKDAADLRGHQIELQMQNEELKTAQEDLGASLARYLDLYDLAPVGYITLSEQGLILESNLTAATLLGESRSKMVRQALSGFILKEDQDIYYRHRKLLFESGEPQECELRLLKKDGATVWVHIAATAAEHDGAPVCRMVMSDITGQKQVEDALQESEARFRLLYEKAPLGYQSLDEKGHFIEVNQAWLDTLGYLREEVIGRSFADFLHPDWREHFKENFPRFKALGEILGVEFEMVKKNGAFILVSFNGKISKDKNGNFQQTHCIFHDITEQRRAEAEKADLEARNRHLQKVESLGRMAGAIAHHFNNQLSVVTGNLELVLDDLAGDTKNREALLQSMMAAQKAAAVSRQMLIYLGQNPGKHDPIDLSEACRQSLSLLQAAIPKGMTLNVDFPVSGPVIRSNAGQIQQILTHLITNAWESISNQGSIGLAIRTVALEDIPPSRRFPMDWQPQPVPHACLEVSDTGCGISKKDIEKLFDPFFTTKFTGRGMGLSVIRGLVTAQSGGITVDSEPGCGSVFRIYLPLSTEKIPCRQKKPAAPGRKAETGGTVLLIEDEEMVRKMVKTMLTRLGYTVVEAQDGAQAVEIFRQRQNEIRCVLSDLTMPGMDGWETLTALRKIRADVPVILSSGYDEESVMAGDHPELPQAFLYKPYQMTLLTQALAKALDHD